MSLVEKATRSTWSKTSVKAIIEAAAREAAVLLGERASLSTAQAVSVAIRHAPSMCIAEAALATMLARGDTVTAIKAIDPTVAAALRTTVSGCQLECTAAQADRLAAWLAASPYELRKARTARAAIKAAAQVFTHSPRPEGIAAADVTPRLPAGPRPPVLSMGRLALGRHSACIESLSESLSAAAASACAGGPEPLVAAELKRCGKGPGSVLVVRVSLPRAAGIEEEAEEALRRRADQAVEAALGVARAADEARARAACLKEELRVAARDMRNTIQDWQSLYKGDHHADDEAGLLPPFKHRGGRRPESACKRPGVEGRRLRRRGRAAACERRRGRAEKACASSWA